MNNRLVLWIIAAFLGWNKFDYPYNSLSAFSIVVLLFLTIYIWIKFFPKSKIGKSLTLNEVINESSTYTETSLNIGDEGEALSTLRPAGIAVINNERVMLFPILRGLKKVPVQVIDIQKVY